MIIVTPEFLEEISMHMTHGILCDKKVRKPNGSIDGELVNKYILEKLKKVYILKVYILGAKDKNISINKNEIK